MSKYGDITQFKVEDHITPVQLQTKLNQWRHDYIVEVQHFQQHEDNSVTAVIQLTKIPSEEIKVKGGVTAEVMDFMNENDKPF